MPLHMPLHKYTPKRLGVCMRTLSANHIYEQAGHTLTGCTD